MKPSTATLLVVSGGSFMVTLDGAGVQMVLPVLHREFGVPIATVQWAMTAFLLLNTVMYLPAGRIGDRWGRSLVWRCGILAFAVATLVCALVPGMWWLIGARALQGTTAALIVANAAPVLVETFPRQRGRALAVGSIAIGLGLVLGPPIAALLTRALSWRLLFALTAPVGFVLWRHTRRWPRPRPRAPRSVDPWGVVSSVLGLGCLLVGITFGRGWGWSSRPTLLVLGAGALSLVLFALGEKGRPDSLLRGELFRRRTFLSGALANLLGYLALFTLTATMPFFLVGTQHRSLIVAGLLVGVVPVALALAAPVSGALSDRIGSRGVCTAGLLLVAAGLGSGLLLERESGVHLVVLIMALVGLGLGAFDAPNAAAALGVLPAGELGVGTATLGVMRNLGMTLGTALAATLLGTSHVEGLPDAAAELTVTGTSHALGAGALAALLGAVAAALRPGGARESE